MKKTILASIVLAFSAGAASAASVTFGLGCGSNVNGVSVACDTAPGGSNKAAEYNALADSFSLNVGGVGLTVSGAYLNNASSGIGGPSGGTISYASSGGDAKVGRYYGGVGVNNHKNDAHTIDGNGRRDYVRLDFSEEVSISNLMFRYYTNGSRFTLLEDTNNDGVLSAGDMYVYDKVAGSVNVSPSFTDTSFFVYSWTDSSFKLKSITAHTVSEVPLPAAGWLLLAGLGGMAAMRKRKS